MALQESEFEHGSMVDFEVTSVKIERVRRENRALERECEVGFGFCILGCLLFAS